MVMNSRSLTESESGGMVQEVLYRRRLEDFAPLFAHKIKAKKKKSPITSSQRALGTEGPEGVLIRSMLISYRLDSEERVSI